MITTYNNEIGQNKTKEGHNMNRETVSYLNAIIREHAYSTKYGLTLDISDIDPKEQEDIADYLFNHDPATKELILDRIHDLIQERLPLIESENYYERGLRPILDQQTGEVNWK